MICPRCGASTMGTLICQPCSFKGLQAANAPAQVQMVPRTDYDAKCAEVERLKADDAALHHNMSTEIAALTADLKAAQDSLNGCRKAHSLRCIELQEMTRGLSDCQRDLAAAEQRWDELEALLIANTTAGGGGPEASTVLGWMADLERGAEGGTPDA